MSAKSILTRIFELKFKLDEAPPEDTAYIQKQIDEQLGILQCVVQEPMESIERVIAAKYPEWLDGRFP
jgi:hypothetical protein